MALMTIYGLYMKLPGLWLITGPGGVALLVSMIYHSSPDTDNSIAPVDECGQGATCNRSLNDQDPITSSHLKGCRTGFGLPFLKHPVSVSVALFCAITSVLLLASVGTLQAGVLGGFVVLGWVGMYLERRARSRS